MGSNIKTSASLALQMDSGFSPFPAKVFNKGLQWAQALGFDGVELIIQHPNEVNADELMKTLERCHLLVSTIATGQMMGEGLIFCSDNSEIRNAAVKRIYDHIDLSSKLGLPNVTIGLARGKGSPEVPVKSRQRTFIAECVKRCAEYARCKNVRINLEPINRYETCLFNSVEDTASLIEELGVMPTVGILYDTFHSNIEDTDMLQTIAKYGGNFSHVHFADSNRMVPGYGHIDYTAVISELEKVNYRGFVSLECLNIPDAEFVKSHAGALNSFARNNH